MPSPQRRANRETSSSLKVFEVVRRDLVVLVLEGKGAEESVGFEVRRGRDEVGFKETNRKKAKTKTVSPDVERFALAFVLVACSVGRKIMCPKHGVKQSSPPDPVARPEGQGREHCVGRRLAPPIVQVVHSERSE